MKKIIILMACISLWPMSIHCEPDQTFNHLMEDPVSVLDFGIFQVNEYLKGNITIGASSALIVISYDWTANRLKINAFSVPYKAVNRLMAKSECKSAINQLRRYLGINPENGKPLSGDSSFLGSYFAHSGYSRKNRPESLEKDIDSLTELQAQIQFEKEGLCKCNGKLASSEVYFAE